MWLTRIGVSVTVSSVDGENALTTHRATQEWRTRWATAIHAHRTGVLHMSQPELGRLLGVSQSTVGMWESGRYVPHDLMKIRVMRLMAMDPREMFRPLDADPVVFPEADDQ
jgi:DNA-binding transcriptional regulator YiaG